MDDSELVKLINNLDVSSCSELDNSDSDDEVLFAPTTRHPRQIISSESENDSEIDDSDNESDNELFGNFQEISVNKDTEYNSRLLFLETSGPKHMPIKNSEPIAYFNLFFTDAFLDNLKIETNRYARQFMRNIEPANKSRVKEWKNTTIAEMRAFIAVILEMGITRKPTIFSYWSKNHRYMPWFGQMFSRNRFQLILKFFHVVDNKKLSPRNSNDYDPSAKFQPIVDYANKTFRFHYTPNQHLSIDESLVGTKCKSSLTQYLPNKKHHRWGIKFWMLTDAITRYCLGFYCYRGAKQQLQTEANEIKEKGLSHVVIHKLLNVGNYFMKGYHEVADNFFTSILLARSLFEKITLLTGTLRNNRKYIPSTLKQKLEIGKSKYFRSNEILLAAYREKKSHRKNVLLLSTHAVAENKTITIQRGQQRKIVEKPLIVHNYNEFMGGVDISDMMLYAYLDERKTLKFWKKIVFSVFFRMVLNLYILYKMNTDHRHLTRLKFISKIIGSITTEWRQKTLKKPHLHILHSHVQPQE